MRKKWFCKFVIALIAITGIFWYVKVANSAFPVGRDFTVIPDGAEYAPGQLLVRFAPKTNGMQRSTAEKNQILNSLGGGIIKHTYKIPGLTLVKLPAGLTVRDALKTFNKEIGILYAEPDYRIYFAKTPNDPCFTEGELWGMHNTGQIPPGGTPDADIDAPEAWEIATDSDVIVAVIDTGTDCDHEDLEDNMWVNTDEYPGDWNEDERPGIEFVDDDDDGLIDEDSQGRDYREQGWNNDLKEDDDENGYIDDINGWDFGYGDNEPEDSYPHGTHVAGTVGAVGDNDKGVVGVCWDVSIMNLKIFHSGTTGPNALLNAAVEAIEYADDKGASVLNCSFMIGWSQSLEDVIDEADANGVLIVAAAGNGDFDIDEPPLSTFPACDDSNNIIGVMATDQNDNRSDLPLGKSNWGATSVDLSAPGSDIRSCLNQQGGYFDNSGTSMATPHVSGACALLWSLKPELSHYEVRQIILDSVDVIPQLENDPEHGRLCVTAGRLNLYNALSLATDTPSFTIKDFLSYKTAWFGNLGNLFLEGDFDPNTTPTATSNKEFRVKNSSGTDVAIIDTATGNMVIKGDLYESHEGELDPPSGSFIVKNSSGDVVAFINADGDLYLKGKVYENAEEYL